MLPCIEMMMAQINWADPSWWTVDTKADRTRLNDYTFFKPIATQGKKKAILEEVKISQ